MRGPNTLYLLPRLAELRKARFLTQTALAQKAGLSKTAITTLENGGKAKPDTVRKIAEALEITREELVQP